MTERMIENRIKKLSALEEQIAQLFMKSLTMRLPASLPLPPVTGGYSEKMGGSLW